MRQYKRTLSAINSSVIALILFTIFISPVVSQAQEPHKESIAVLDLEGRGISTIEAATLTDRMRSELVKTGAVTVVERGQMQTILQEQDFQMTGCTSDECAVEIGQMLGISTMYSGSIGKIGATYTVDVRAISIETGAIVNTMSKNYRGEIDGLIQEIEHLAWEMVGLVHPDDLLQQLGDTPGLSLEDVGRRGRQAQAQAEPEPESPASQQPQVRKDKKKGGFGKLLMWAVILGGGGAGAYIATQTPVDTPPVNTGIGPPPAFPPTH